MLLLFETSAGYALFKVLKPGKLAETDKIWEDFTTPEGAAGIVKLKAFAPFGNTTEAVVAATSIIESTLDKSLKKFLKKNVTSKDIADELAVSDNKLGGLIKEKLDIQCVHNDSVMELFRGVRTQMDSLLGGTEDSGAMKAMQLGLSHSLSRYKLKFSADKVDIMIVQAIGLLDDLDKEINIYAMRVREWYGWHFPEMAKIMNDNMFYAKCVQRMGMRTNCKNCDFSDILGDDTMEETLKRTAETSMGTEISESDLVNIVSLCMQVLFCPVIFFIYILQRSFILFNLFILIIVCVYIVNNYHIAKVFLFLTKKNHLYATDWLICIICVSLAGYCLQLLSLSLSHCTSPLQSHHHNRNSSNPVIIICRSCHYQNIVYSYLST